MQQRMSLQTSGSTFKSGTTHTSARSGRAVAYVVRLLILGCMPKLSSCTQLHGSRLQLSKHLSKHQVIGHDDHYPASVLRPEEKEYPTKGAPQEPVLLQVGEEETPKSNKVTPAQWPWVQPGIITKNKDVKAALKHAARDSTTVVTQ